MRSLAVSLLLTAALFSGVVMGVMIVTRLSEPAVPPDSPTIQSLRAALAKDSSNEGLKEALREEDQQARQNFFTHRRRLATGAYLLLAGLAATVICARWYASLERKTPQPTTPAEREDADRWLARRRRNIVAVAVVSVVVLAGLLIFGLAGGPPIPPAPAAGRPCRKPSRRPPRCQRRRGERLQGELAAIPRPRRHRHGQGRRLAAEMGRRDRREYRLENPGPDAGQQLAGALGRPAVPHGRRRRPAGSLLLLARLRQAALANADLRGSRRREGGGHPAAAGHRLRLADAGDRRRARSTRRSPAPTSRRWISTARSSGRATWGSRKTRRTVPTAAPLPCSSTRTRSSSSSTAAWSRPTACPPCWRWTRRPARRSGARRGRSAAAGARRSSSPSPDAPSWSPTAARGSSRTIRTTARNSGAAPG